MRKALFADDELFLQKGTSLSSVQEYLTKVENFSLYKGEVLVAYAGLFMSDDQSRYGTARKTRSVSDTVLVVPQKPDSLVTEPDACSVCHGGRVCPLGQFACSSCGEQNRRITQTVSLAGLDHTHECVGRRLLLLCYNAGAAVDGVVDVRAERLVTNCPQYESIEQFLEGNPTALMFITSFQREWLASQRNKGESQMAENTFGSASKERKLIQKPRSAQFNALTSWDSTIQPVNNNKQGEQHRLIYHVSGLYQYKKKKVDVIMTLMQRGTSTNIQFQQKSKDLKSEMVPSSMQIMIQSITIPSATMCLDKVNIVSGRYATMGKCKSCQKTSQPDQITLLSTASPLSAQSLFGVHNFACMCSTIPLLKSFSIPPPNTLILVHTNIMYQITLPSDYAYKQALNILSCVIWGDHFRQYLQPQLSAYNKFLLDIQERCYTKQITPVLFFRQKHVSSISCPVLDLEQGTVLHTTSAAFLYIATNPLLPINLTTEAYRIVQSQLSFPNMGLAIVQPEYTVLHQKQPDMTFLDIIHNYQLITYTYLLELMLYSSALEQDSTLPPQYLLANVMMQKYQVQQNLYEAHPFCSVQLQVHDYFHTVIRTIAKGNADVVASKERLHRILQEYYLSCDRNIYSGKVDILGYGLSIELKYQRGCGGLRGLYRKTRRAAHAHKIDYFAPSAPYSWEIEAYEMGVDTTAEKTWAFQKHTQNSIQIKPSSVVHTIQGKWSLQPVLLKPVIGRIDMNKYTYLVRLQQQHVLREPGMKPIMTVHTTEDDVPEKPTTQTQARQPCRANNSVNNAQKRWQVLAYTR